MELPNVNINFDPNVLPTRATRRKIVTGTLILCWVLIFLVFQFGDPTNTLHSSALAWAFSTNITVIFAYVFGAIVDNWNVFRYLKENKQ